MTNNFKRNVVSRSTDGSKISVSSSQFLFTVGHNYLLSWLSSLN